MHRLHSGLTVAVAIEKGKSAELRLLLKDINASILKSITDLQEPANLADQGAPLDEADRFAGKGHDMTANNQPITSSGGTSVVDVQGNLSSGGLPVVEQALSGVSIDASRIKTAFNDLQSANSGEHNPSDQLVAKSKVLTSEGEGPEAIGNGKDTFISVTTGTQKLLCDFENSETILFVSGVILPAQRYGEDLLPETFVFATSYCGSQKKHFKDLITTCKEGLCEIFKHCIDFPNDGIVTDTELMNYLVKHRQKSAFNSRYNCITKDDVKKEKALKSEIQNFIDSMEHPDPKKKKDPLVIRTLIQEHIKNQGGKYKWADQPAKDNLTEFLNRKRAIISPIAAALVIIALTVMANPDSLGWFWSIGLGLAIIIDIIAIGYLLTLALRYIIARDKNPTAVRPTDDWVRKVTATQLRPVINEMTAAAPLKKGIVRRLFYYAALRVVDFARSHLMNVPTVSSIRWLSIDNKRRLLFLSNYSNTTDFYVREFLTGNTPRGVNFMFTNGQSFPDARKLTQGGITDDPEGYMNVIHTHQHVTDLWYSHDYNLTVDQILRQRELRNGLYKQMTEKEALHWLRLI